MEFRRHRYTPLRLKPGTERGASASARPVDRRALVQSASDRTPVAPPPHASETVSMESRWSDADAAATPELDGLLYASRLVGQDPNLVLWGGGNTSVKRREHTALDDDVEVLRVKGSGSDLKSVQVRDFPGLRREALARLRDRDV